MLALALLSGMPQALAANEGPSKQLRIQVSEPEGFSALTGPQLAVADIYFGGERVGDAQIRFQPGSLTILAPDAVVARLPALVDASAVFAALSAPDLPANAHLTCSPGADPAECGRLVPAVAGVIFDPARFRVDIFVNPALLAVRSDVEREYIMSPEVGLSFVNALGAVVSGSSSGSEFYNIQSRTIVASGDARLRADIAYATEFGLQADRLAIEVDKPGWRYSVGAFWAPGTDLVGRRKMLGVGIETQWDTRLDRDDMRGNPIIVFLGQRSRVDILRDGRVLSSHIYEAGNQRLDTAALPDGSYEVLLNIEEAGGARRTERHFFTKNPRITPIGQQLYFVYAGVLADKYDRGLLPLTDIPFMQAGLGRRLGPRFAVDLTAIATDQTGVAELGGYFLAPETQIRLAVIGSTNYSYGALVQGNLQKGPQFSLNFDLRQIMIDGSAPRRTDGISTDARDENGRLFLPAATYSYTQFNGIVSYSTGSAQFRVVGSYRDEKHVPTRYSIGPSCRWEVMRKGNARLALNGDFAFTDAGKSGFVGINLQWLGMGTNIDGNMGVRSVESGEGRRTKAVGNIHGSLDRDVAGADVAAGAGYETDIGSDTVNANTQWRTDRLAAGGEIISNVGEGPSNTQYSFGFQTLIAARNGVIAFEGRDQNESMIVAKVGGARPDDRFEIYVNDSLAGELTGEQRLALALPAYREYDLRIRQSSGGMLKIDGKARRLGLYPGNVAQSNWAAEPISAVLGRLVFEDGRPVKSAGVTSTAGIGQTDDDGNFLIEAPLGGRLNFSLPDGSSCGVALPESAGDSEYLSLGSLVCRPTTPASNFSLAPSAGSPTPLYNDRD